jgi:hypothetical protein
MVGEAAGKRCGTLVCGPWHEAFFPPHVRVLQLNVGDYTALLDSAAKASMRVLSDDRTLEDFKNIEMWMKRVGGSG